MAKRKPVAAIPPTMEARNEAISAFSRTTQPVTAKQLSGMLAAPYKISESFLVPILDDAVVNEQVYLFPPATAKGKPRYWDRDLTEFGCSLILQLIQKKGPQAKAKLKTSAKRIGEGPFQTAFQSLIDTRRLREHPPLGKTKVLKYGIEPPEVEPYLKDIGKLLAKVVEQLTKVGVDRKAIVVALGNWITQAGLPGTITVSVASNEPASLSIRELNLLMLMRQIEPGAERGTLVTSRELRRAANVDKSTFDQAVLNLARQGRLMLHRHDHASAINSSDRDELVTDGAGTYYVGMALRRTDG